MWCVVYLDAHGLVLSEGGLQGRHHPRRRAIIRPHRAAVDHTHTQALVLQGRGGGREGRGHHEGATHRGAGGATMEEGVGEGGTDTWHTQTCPHKAHISTYMARTKHIYLHICETSQVEHDDAKRADA